MLWVLHLFGAPESPLPVLDVHPCLASLHHVPSRGAMAGQAIYSFRREVMPRSSQYEQEHGRTRGSTVRKPMGRKMGVRSGLDMERAGTRARVESISLLQQSWISRFWRIRDGKCQRFLMGISSCSSEQGLHRWYRFYHVHAIRQGPEGKVDIPPTICFDRVNAHFQTCRLLASFQVKM